MDCETLPSRQLTTFLSSKAVVPLTADPGRCGGSGKFPNRVEMGRLGEPDEGLLIGRDLPIPL
jgi:hypothetical protein